MKKLAKFGWIVALGLLFVIFPVCGLADNQAPPSTIELVAESEADVPVLEVELSADTPFRRIVSVGDNGTEEVATRVDLSAVNEAVKIDSVAIQRIGGKDSDFQSVSLWDDSTSTQIGTDQLLIDGKTTFTWPPEYDWYIPKGVTETLTLRAEFAADQTKFTTGAASGNTPKFCITSIIYLGVESARIVTVEPNICGNEITIRKSKPTIAAASLPSTVLSTGEKVLFRWTVTADEKGDIGWKGIEFDISGPLNEREGIVEIEVWDVASNSQVSGTVAYINTPSSSSNVVFEATNEQVVVNGQTNTYELRGNVLYGGKAGDFIATKIKSKSTELVSGDYASLLNLASSFIWTDRSTDNHSENTSDWTTDHLIPGIPTTTLALTRNDAPIPEPEPEPLPSPKTWEVPQNYTIHQAFSMAVAGDTILIAAGNYNLNSKGGIPWLQGDVIVQGAGKDKTFLSGYLKSEGNIMARDLTIFGQDESPAISAGQKIDLSNIGVYANGPVAVYTGWKDVVLRIHDSTIVSIYSNESIGIEVVGNLDPDNTVIEGNIFVNFDYGVSVPTAGYEEFAQRVIEANFFYKVTTPVCLAAFG